MDKIDPVADDWTGTFRDGRPVNPLGPKPENAVTGTVYTVNAWRNDPLLVPIHFGAHRFWRHTVVAARAAEAAAKMRAQQSQRSDGDDAAQRSNASVGEVEIDGEEAGDGVVALVNTSCNGLTHPYSHTHTHNIVSIVSSLTTPQHNTHINRCRVF